jgi:hypothetical protein
MGYVERADWFLATAGRLSPKDIAVSLYLIENKLKSGDNIGVERYLERLFKHHRIKAAIEYSQGLPENMIRVSHSPDLVAPLVLEKIKKKAEKFKRIN